MRQNVRLVQKSGCVVFQNVDTSVAQELRHPYFRACLFVIAQ